MVRNNNTTRNIHFEFIDLLRAVAIIGVLLQHSATYMIEVDNSFPALFYQKSSRWNILLFIFISGFLLIPKEIPISLMWKKYIRRIFNAFIFWSLLYSIYNFTTLILNGDESGGGILKSFVGDIVSGGTQRLWYLVMLIGLYAIIPVISSVYHYNHQIFKYFVLLLSFVSIVLPTICLIEPINTLVGLDYGRIKSVFPSGIFVFYCLLGGTMRIIDIDKVLRFKWIFYFCFLCSYLLFGIMLYHHVNLAQSFIGYFFITIGFVLYSYTCYPRWPLKVKMTIKNIADCSFGIYLLHTFIQYGLQEINFCMELSSMLYAWIAIPIYCMVLFLISWLGTWLIRLSSFGRSIS